MQSRLRNERAFRTARNVVGFLARLAGAPGFLAASDRLHQLDVVEKDNQARNLRKVAQIDAALDRNGIDKVVDLLAGAGAVVEAPKELKYPGGKLLAWSLSFFKKPLPG